jgi:hypothetical protein
VDLAVSLTLYNILYNINFDFIISVSKIRENCKSTEVYFKKNWKIFTVQGTV